MSERAAGPVTIDPDHLPVIVAAGQAIERDEVVSPMTLLTRAADAALGHVPRLRDVIEQVSVVNVLTRVPPSSARRLALRTGLQPRVCETTTVGGNTPQWLVTRAAAAISAGELAAALIVGGETQRSARAGRGQAPSDGDDERRRAEDALVDEHPPDATIGDERPGFGDVELGAALLAPVHIYPLFESALAHHAGRSPAEQRAFIGGLMAPLTEVAATHPYAWFPTSRTPAELATVGPENRLVAEPYTKLHCAFLNVDQAAAVIICSLAAARRAGVAERAVHCWSGADAAEVWFPSARRDPGEAPGLHAAAAAALRAAAIGVDDVAALDLYSCFPCALQMGADALGIDVADRRRLTVTGGLPYFGGPGNNYTLHAIATMTDRLRERPGAGLVSGLGWFATKHSVGIYGSSPGPAGRFRAGDTTRAQAAIDASAAPTTTDAGGAGPAEVIASTVIYGPDGTGVGAPVIARLGDGRQVAATYADPDVAAMAGRSLVGEVVTMSGSPPTYRCS